MTPLMVEFICSIEKQLRWDKFPQFKTMITLFVESYVAQRPLDRYVSEGWESFASWCKRTNNIVQQEPNKAVYKKLAKQRQKMINDALHNVVDVWNFYHGSGKNKVKASYWVKKIGKKTIERAIQFSWK